MIIEVSMKADPDKMSVSSWWATSPGFALAALQRQLLVAQTIWPDELRGFAIKSDGYTPPEPPPLPDGGAGTIDRLENETTLAVSNGHRESE